jgi:hypothetical protein
MNGILERFPQRSATLPVFAVIAAPIFGWTLTSWLWKLPSWLKFLTPGEIGAIFFYAMLTAFIESLLVLGFLVLLCFLLPSAFRDHFVVRGTWLATGLALAILGNGIWRGLTRFTYLEVSLVLWSLVSLVVIVILTVLSTRVRMMARAAAWVSDRLIIFLYVLIPLSILSMLVVLVRNVFSG